MSKEVDQQIQRTNEVMAQRKRGAAEVLAGGERSTWSFGLVGLTSEIDGVVAVGDLFIFRKVRNPPYGIELLAALKDQHHLSSLVRYTEFVTHEISTNSAIADKEPQAQFNLTWLFIAMLRVRTGAEFLVPAALSRSWEVIAALPQQSLEARMLEDIPQMGQLGSEIKLSLADFDQSVRDLSVFPDLMKERRFRLAVETITSHQQLLDKRMMMAAMWAAIEALLNVDHELRFRIAELSACLLAERGTSRYESFKRFLRLYDKRSLVVHGGEISDQDLHDYVLETQNLLRRLILVFVEKGKLFSKEDLEKLLLS
jgi:hypothetical protein